MRYLGTVALAALSALAASSALASQPLSQQVQLEARIAEVSGEFRTGLGFNWRAPDGTYHSTANEPPGSGSGSLFNGVGGAGGTVWFNTGLLPAAPGNPNALNVGVGVDASGNFGDDEVLSLARRNSDVANIFVNQTINYAVDVVARASIPIVLRPSIAPGGNNLILFIEPFAGVSVIGTETEIMSDRTGIGGGVLEGAKTGTQVGFVAGIGGTTEIARIPFLGDIPLLGGLFYKARHVPGGSASVTANGVTETGSVDSSWQHEGLLVLITPFIIRDDRE